MKEENGGELPERIVYVRPESPSNRLSPPDSILILTRVLLFFLAALCVMWRHTLGSFSGVSVYSPGTGSLTLAFAHKSHRLQQAREGKLRPRQPCLAQTVSCARETDQLASALCRTCLGYASRCS